MSRWGNRIEDMEIMVSRDGKMVTLRGEEAYEEMVNSRPPGGRRSIPFDENGVGMLAGSRVVRCPHGCGGVLMGDETDPKKVLGLHYRMWHLVHHGHGIPPSIRPDPNAKKPRPEG